MPLSLPSHSMLSRRTMLQAGSLGLLGLGMNHVAALRAADVVSQSKSGGTAKSVIFVFLSGGWKDELDRPHHIYHGEPIRGLI